VGLLCWNNQAKRQKLLEERRLAAAINKETLPDHLSDEEDDEEVRHLLSPGHVMDWEPQRCLEPEETVA
jgi:hypothetical protein